MGLRCAKRKFLMKVKLMNSKSSLLAQVVDFMRLILISTQDDIVVKVGVELGNKLWLKLCQAQDQFSLS